MHRLDMRLFAHAAAHFAVDFSCFFALWLSAFQQASAPFWILCYNALAFMLQAPLGALLDRINDTRPATILGCGLVAWGVLACAFPLPCVLLLGIGNAFFHAGGAVATLRQCPQDTFAAGTYVAPGALGVALGTLCGKGIVAFSPFSSVLLLLGCICFIWFCGAGGSPVFPVQGHPSSLEGLGTGAIMLCLISIGVRSFAGFAVKTTEGVAAPILLSACASCLGKFGGGIVAHRVPWRVVGLLGAGIGGLMMTFFSASPAVYAGLFLFNLSMPLTLCAVMAALPGHIGLGFGLTTLALFLGSAPLYALPNGYKAPLWLMLATTLCSALLLFFALRRKTGQPTQRDLRSIDKPLA